MIACSRALCRAGQAGSANTQSHSNDACLYDDDDSREYLEQAQKALPASARAKAYRNKLQARGSPLPTAY